MTPIESDTSVDEIPSECQGKQEFAVELLAAFLRGDVTGDDFLNIMSQSETAASVSGRSKYRTRLRELLGPDDPIVSAFDALVERSRRQKIGLGSRVHWLDDDEKPIPPEWAGKIAEGQRRSHASGTRKPLPPDFGERVSRGKKKR